MRFTKRLNRPHGQDPRITSNLYEARFQLLRGALPPEGVVGYIAEAKRPGRFGFDGSYLMGLYLTQYTLAPLVVVDSTAPTLVIGNFRSGEDERNVGDPTLVVTRNFGDGVFLSHHQPR